MNHGFDEFEFEVEFMSCEVDRAEELKVISADSHFAEYANVHPSKIKQGKVFLIDYIIEDDREKVLSFLRKKDSPYVYFDFCIKGEMGENNLVHCTAQNFPRSTISKLTIADVSRSEKKTEILKKRADALGSLIDIVNVGICLFKVNKDMHFEAIYVNQACCSFFGTDKERVIERAYRIDELIHPEDKSSVFQAIGLSMATKQPVEMIFRVKTHRSRYLWCKFSADINRYEPDGCPVFHATFTNVSGLVDEK